MSAALGADAIALIPRPNWTRRCFAAIAFFEFAFVALVLLAFLSVRAMAPRTPSKSMVEEIAVFVGVSLVFMAGSAWAILAGILACGSSRKTAALCCLANSALALSLLAILATLLAEEFGGSQPSGKFWLEIVRVSVFIAMFVGVTDYLLCRRLAKALPAAHANAIALTGLLAAIVQFGGMLGIANGFRGFFGPSLFFGLAAWVVAVLLSASRCVMMYRAIRAWTSGRSPLATPPAMLP